MPSYVDPSVLQEVESILSLARMEAQSGVTSSDPLRSAVLQSFGSQRSQGLQALESMCSMLPYPPEAGWWLAAAYIECQRWGHARHYLVARLKADPTDERSAALLQLMAAAVHAQAQQFMQQAGYGLMAMAFAALLVLALRARPRAAAAGAQGAAKDAAKAAATQATRAAVTAAVLAAAAAPPAAAPPAPGAGGPAPGASAAPGGQQSQSLLLEVASGLLEEVSRGLAAARKALGL